MDCEQQQHQRTRLLFEAVVTFVLGPVDLDHVGDDAIQRFLVQTFSSLDSAPLNVAFDAFGKWRVKEDLSRQS